ncbi:ATP-grasp domain-containing protein [Pseudoalteromonas sp. SMS1]|uniref:ATP-grasp domain-containing protein n=1 Tax=Pseudoalteromonas sp. SMS1 TaxID=2908894 RepID=UPI001F311C9B|nr:ATP-grasp domain-containing protein [Pseudoalteromonas sp. SMS1]MCF2859914.1 ATP-grasp domain-containing protein [Pseudoalteromonas sp. SMS1]
MYIPHVYWAHFDPEASWHDGDYLSLPAPKGVRSAMDLALLDDMFVPARAQDIALTITPKCQALHDYHVRLGGSYDTHSVFESIHAWQSADKPAWPDIFASMQTDAEKSHSAIRDRLSSCIQVPYAHLAEAPVSNVHSSPGLNAIRYANSKSTITTLCHQLEIPSLGTVIDHQEDINQLLDLDYPYVLKEAFGVSGKGTYLVREQRIAERLVRHFQTQSKQGKQGGMIAQPWLDIELDFSSQWAVSSCGELTLIGLCQVENKGFRFNGINLSCQALEQVVARSDYYEQIRLLLSELFKAGYFGPICVDSALLKDGTVYPVIEVNARESMGSIALRWRDKLSLGNSLRLRQYDVIYQAPVSFEAILHKLGLQGALLCCGQLGGIVPITASSMALTQSSNFSKGRWVQLECASKRSESYRATLQSCLSDFGVTLQ